MNLGDTLELRGKTQKGKNKIHEHGDTVMLTSHFTGTFTKDFDLSAMGMGVVPASGEMVTFPSSTSEISFDGDKVSKTHNIETEQKELDKLENQVAKEVDKLKLNKKQKRLYVDTVIPQEVSAPAI